MLSITQLSFDEKNGLVKRLHFDQGDFPVTSSGCEVGNWLGFFSQEKLGGFCCHLHRCCVRVTSDQAHSMFEVTLPHARLQIDVQDWLDAGIWRRRYSIEALALSKVGDFVVRSAWPSHSWPVTDQGVPHIGRNAYRSGARRELGLLGAGVRLRSRLTRVVLPPGFGLQGYWRDAKDGNWVLHHRALVSRQRADQTVWRWRYHAWLGPKIPLISHFLWGFSERVLSHLPGPTPTVQAMGVVSLEPGASLTLEAALWLELS